MLTPAGNQFGQRDEQRFIRPSHAVTLSGGKSRAAARLLRQDTIVRAVRLYAI